MTGVDREKKIRIIKNGPYHVTGCIPLSEKIITPKGKVNEFRPGRTFPSIETYDLCRYGRSGEKPFCDGTHETVGFDGTEVASRAAYEERAKVCTGPAIDLLDDDRCAYARFCHREHGNAWQLVKQSKDPQLKKEVIKAACDCPTGRLVAVEKNGDPYEDPYEPSISIIQDPAQDASAGIFVRGGIPIESCDGQIYEIRNRAALCRCGKSRNTPFCDATHISIGFSDHD